MRATVLAAFAVLASVVFAQVGVARADGYITKSVNPIVQSVDPIVQSVNPIGQSPNPTAKLVRITAERFAFTPSEIVVEQGTTVEFHLTSDDTDHGFRIVGTEVNVRIPKRRRGETVVRYVADTAGKFTIECSRPCGAGHTAMQGSLVVK